MFGKDKREEVKEDIRQLKEQFGDMSPSNFKKGDWLVQLIRKVLENHSEKVSAEYFRSKYTGLDNERIAYRLTKTSAQYTGAAGAAAAAAVSAGELSTAVSGGTSLAVVGSSMIGELTYITQQQIKLIHDVGLVLEADINTDDPEDVMALLWLALDVNIYEEASNIALKAGPRGVAYLGRKALRRGVREGMKQAVAKFGGAKLARKLTERTILKLVVPGINMPIAYGVNRWFTKKLGKKAIGRLKHRSLMVYPLRRLDTEHRNVQLLTLPIIYHVGIADEPKDIDSRLIEMQAVTARKLGITESEDEQTRDWIAEPFDVFLRDVAEETVGEAHEALLDVGIGAHLLSKAETASGEKLRELASCLEYEAAVEERIEFIEDRYVE